MRAQVEVVFFIWSTSYLQNGTQTRSRNWGTRLLTLPDTGRFRGEGRINLTVENKPHRRQAMGPGLWWRGQGAPRESEGLSFERLAFVTPHGCWSGKTFHYLLTRLLIKTDNDTVQQNVETLLWKRWGEQELHFPAIKKKHVIIFSCWVFWSSCLVVLEF